MRYLSVVIVLFVVFHLTPAKSDERVPLKIIWFSNLYEKPNPRNNPFWHFTKRFIKASAYDLNIDLMIVYTEQNHIYLLEKAEELMSDSETRPDAILYHNYKYTGKKLLEIAETYQVKSFVFNAGFTEKENVGLPREKYRHWIGELYPDDTYTGWILAKTLMEEAEKLPGVKDTGRMQVFSFAGSKHSQASLLRIAGNEQFAKDNSRYENVSTFFADWSKDKVFEVTGLVIKRQPDLKIFWAASDLMAQGVIESALENGWQPGRDFVVGGVDCLPEAQDLIKKGLMTVSVGGHYTDGAWAILLIHDYLMGIDFLVEQGVTMYSKMFALTSGNNKKSSVLADQLSLESIESINFKQYSRWFNPEIVGYSLDALTFINEN